MFQKSLTVKQEVFCTAYIETGNASEAYRQVYDAQNMNAATINRKAFELTANGKITARLDELRTQHAARHVITIDSLIDELEEARQLAKLNAQASAMVTATMSKAKVLGLDKGVKEGDDSLTVHIVRFADAEEVVTDVR